MDNLTQKQMLQIMLNEFKEYRVEWKEYKKEQQGINDLVIRHDEKIKSMWKIPVISGGVITLISGIAIIISLIP